MPNKQHQNNIEHLADLAQLNDLAAIATKKANERAKKVLDKLVEVRNGKLIRKTKGQPIEVIRKLDYRSVKKGESFLISDK